MIRHICMWQLNDELKGDDKIAAMKKMKSSIEELKPVIPQMLECEVGINVNPKEKFDIMVNEVFENLETLQYYLDHPAHKEVVSFVKTIVKQRCAVDYEF